MTRGRTWASVGRHKAASNCEIRPWLTLYFYYGNTRIRVAEHFNDRGKPIGALIEGVIRYSAARQMEKTTEN